MFKIKLFFKVHCKRASSSHFNCGTPEPQSSLEVRRICDDLNYVLLQVNIIEMCIVNMYTVLILTNKKYSIIIIMFTFIFTPIPLISAHITLNVLCKCTICHWYCSCSINYAMKSYQLYHLDKFLATIPRVKLLNLGLCYHTVCIRYGPVIYIVDQGSVVGMATLYGDQISVAGDIFNTSPHIHMHQSILALCGYSIIETWWHTTHGRGSVGETGEWSG
jgi:hypothetical protein